MKPTVSQLLDILNKPALLKWANKIGLDGVSLDEYRRKSTSNGISLHGQIQRFVENKTPFENRNHQEAFSRFMDGKVMISMERNIETDWFIGRCDACIMINGNVYVCDFKSNSGIYLENKLQLTAYRMAIPGCEVAIVEIPSFIFKPMQFDFKKCELILKCLSKIWELKQEL